MENSVPEIGRHIRTRRRALGLTLDGLATSSGVSVTMLSEVERAVKNPTVRLAWQVARALGCSLTDLLGEGPNTSTTIVRASERSTLTDPETGVERHGVSTELLRRGLEVARYRLPARQSSGELAPNRPGVLEHVVMIGGHLTLRVGGERHRLGPGDHVTYWPQAPVEYRNDGAEACEFLLLSDAGVARRNR